MGSVTLRSVGAPAFEHVRLQHLDGGFIGLDVRSHPVADAVGQAFQISDDILDIIGNKKLLGKRGSDRDNDKLTFPALFTETHVSQVKLFN